jgi:hypothetical protein
MAPGKTLFGRAVRAQQTSACIPHKGRFERFGRVVEPSFCRCFAVFGCSREGKWAVAKPILDIRRDEASRLFVRLRGHAGELPVSRAYVHLFKAM